MSTLRQDIRYAARLIRNNPGFSAMAILTLALGIGANTAIFSLVYGVLLRPLPYPQASRIAFLKPVFFTGGRQDETTASKYLFWREHQHSFKAVASYRGSAGVNLQTADQPERVMNRGVTVDFFRVLGLAPVLGRDFIAGEDEPGATGGAILSNGFWRRRFASDPGVLGRTIVLGTKSYQIIGVAPRGIDSGIAADVYVPLGVKGDPMGGGSNFPAIARLKDGVEFTQAEADMRVVAEQYRIEHPKGMARRETIGVLPYQQEAVRDIRPSLLILLSAVSLVLLIGCANVANLLLARVATRKREIAVRLAIGAGRWRLTRQLLTESLCLAMSACLLGLLLAKVAVDAIVQLRPLQLPRLDDVSLDWTVLAVTVAIALFIGVLFGIAPALQSVSGASFLQETRSTSRSGRTLRAALVTGEFALSMILLIGAALLIRSFINLRMVDPGFDPAHILTMRMTLNGQRYQTGAQVASFASTVAGRVERLPGVEHAAMTNYLPLAHQGMNIPLLSVAGRPNPGDRFLGNLEWFGIAPGFFDVMRIRLRGGREISARDTSASPPVVVINEAFAKQYFPNESAVGHQIVIAWNLLGPKFADTPREVVGVASDIHEGSLSEPASPAVFVPLTQINDSVSATVNQIMPTNLMVRTAGDPLAISREVMKEIHNQDAMLPAFDIRTMEQVLGDSIQTQRFMMVLLGSFAGLALVLAAIGIYGVMSYSVAQRTREIGIRAALGATPSSLLKMIVGQGLILAGIGVIIGLGGAAAVTILLKAYLYGVAPRDLVTFIGTPLLLTAIGLLASYVPARRALRVDPITALRHE